MRDLRGTVVIHITEDTMDLANELLEGEPLSPAFPIEKPALAAGYDLIYYNEMANCWAVGELRDSGPYHAWPLYPVELDNLPILSLEEVL